MRNILVYFKWRISVDGKWSDFGEWSPCDKDCGGGTQSRTRSQRLSLFATKFQSSIKLYILVSTSFVEMKNCQIDQKIFYPC